MKKIDKSFKSQQEIFAWLGSGGKVVYKDYGHIISFIDGKLVSETYNAEVTREFNVPKDWEKVLPPSWEDFLEEYDILCFVQGAYTTLNENPEFIISVINGNYVSEVEEWKEAIPLDITEFQTLEGKWLGRKKEKECSTE